jgi:hypothetical protein
MLEPVQLSAEGARILGSLVEKQLTTPQQYPLTINALVAACNQTSNRDPVVDYDEDAVMSALDRLKEQRLVRFVLPSHGRTAVRFRQVLDETLALDTRQCAVLGVLLLRGPQTAGELRLRTERMMRFEGIDEIEHELQYMASRDEPLVTNIGRRPGQKEERWECSLAPASLGEGAPMHTHAPEIDGDHRTAADPFGDIRDELTSLRAELAALRGDLDALRHSLGE